MKKNNLFLILAIAIITGTIGYYINLAIAPKISDQPLNVNQNRTDQGINRQNCVSDDCLLVNNLNYPVSELTVDIKNSLDSAIEDEYHAFSFYNTVIKKFGQVRPFIMIVNAEQQHINSLIAIYEKYGLKAPSNSYLNKLTAPATLKEACQVGYDAEVKNASLYKNNLLPTVTNYPDITQVFTNLMNASQDKHLPAFDRCN